MVTILKISAIVTLLVIVGASGLWAMFPDVVAKAVVSRAEINACAVMEMQRDYQRTGASPQSANEAIIVDVGEHPNVFAIAASYSWIGIPTVYDQYLSDGRSRCLRMKLRGERIAMPHLSLRRGYHVTRWNGSAALVKNGDPEPVFGCSEGYHPTGTACVKD